jgi:hypothetical protein
VLGFVSDRPAVLETMAGYAGREPPVIAVVASKPRPGVGGRDRAAIWRLDHKMRGYGINLATFDAEAGRRGGACDICGTIAVPRLSVDHDHATGAIRGFLCRECNSALAWCDDSPAIARKLAAYLRRGE